MGIVGIQIGRQVNQGQTEERDRSVVAECPAEAVCQPTFNNCSAKIVASTASEKARP